MVLIGPSLVFVKVGIVFQAQRRQGGGDVEKGIVVYRMFTVPLALLHQFL